MTVTSAPLTGSAAAGTSAPNTSNLRVSGFRTLPAPAELAEELPLTPALARSIERGRADIRAVLNGLDDRLLVIVGPCSIHDSEAGLDYARQLAAVAEEHREDLVIVLRAYFEKPRTTIGWKGLINDPRLDGSHDIAEGLRAARRFLLDAGELGLPVATEFLEPISPQYLADLVGWGAIGARTTESQVHRQLVSGLSMPVGFKNGTDGSLDIALDACQAASSPQSFLGIDDGGRASMVSTAGNPDTHVILRGGTAGPNFSAAHVSAAAEALAARNLNPRLIIDASHANSGKSHVRQAEVAQELADRLGAGGPASAAVAGVMLESFLAEGAQKLDEANPGNLAYGQSITDACMGWETSRQILAVLADAARRRREDAV